MAPSPPEPPALAHRQRIVAPTDGSIVAIDPDISSDRQRITFAAESAGAPLRWNLDGVDLGSAGATVLWPPVHGHDTLALVDAEAQPLAVAHFEVRGVPGLAHRPSAGPRRPLSCLPPAIRLR